jgi:hypothetical protein
VGDWLLAGRFAALQSAPGIRRDPGMRDGPDSSSLLPRRGVVMPALRLLALPVVWTLA